MANLITEKQKKIIKQDYHIRLYAVSLLVLALLGIFFLAYLVPYYLSVSKKDLKVSELFKPVLTAENKENIGESVTQTVNRTMEEMRILEFYIKDNLIPSAYFIRVFENKNSNIKITKLSFNQIKKGQASILVGGLAKNREGLVSFIDDLKTKGGFPVVDSPVSDFAKDSDISFTLDIKTAI
jgi:hypothetical protein